MELDLLKKAVPSPSGRVAEKKEPICSREAFPIVPFGIKKIRSNILRLPYGDILYNQGIPNRSGWDGERSQDRGFPLPVKLSFWGCGKNLN
jgi:hypothetical protein